MDILDKAVGAAAQAGVDIPKIPNIPTSDELAGSAIDAASGLVDSALAKVPDPELLIRQKEAELLKKKAEIDQLLLLAQETDVESIKARLTSLGIPSIPIPVKLPLIDPKVLLALALAQKEKLVADLKNLKSKLNLKKAKQAFTYPLNKPKNFLQGGLSKIPKPPVLEPPSIPSIPTAEDGIQSVRAKIQDEINRGVFDR
jgi:hypothetical protein